MCARLAAQVRMEVLPSQPAPVISTAPSCHPCGTGKLTGMSARQHLDGDFPPELRHIKMTSQPTHAPCLWCHAGHWQLLRCLRHVTVQQCTATAQWHSMHAAGMRLSICRTFVSAALSHDEQRRLMGQLLG